MIINVTRKTIISNHPNFRLGRFFRASIIPRESFSNADCLVLQNCDTALNISRLKNIEFIFTDTSNKVCRIVRSSEAKLFLHVPRAMTTLILPEGASEKSMTSLGDCLDLSAEMTAQVKKSMAINPENLVIGFPGTAMKKSEEASE